MAAVIPITIFVAIISSLSSSSAAGRVGAGGIELPFYKQSEVAYSTYWGQNGWRDEGSLRQTCQSLQRNDIVIISSLTKFGLGRTPTLDLGGHCDPQVSDCTYISGDIRYCQSKGIKVFLSIGGDGRNYSMESDAAASELADYLWNNFLGGISFTRPLGNAGLDGIDFNIQTGRNGRWDILANRLKQKSWILYQVRLSAVAQCRIPDPYLDKAIRSGAFDLVGVKFFGDSSCQYTTNANNLLATWLRWISYPGVNKLYLGIPAFSWANGYIPNDTLYNEIIPVIQGNPKFGGVLLWSKFPRTFAGMESNKKSVVRLYGNN